MKRQYRDVIKLSREFEVEKKINELRSKLNKALESNIDTHEIINLSQELDKYIAFKQRKLVEKINDK